MPDEDYDEPFSYFLLRRSSTTASFPWTESTGHGSTELAPTNRKQMANVDVKMDDVTLFLRVALSIVTGGNGVEMEGTKVETGKKRKKRKTDRNITWVYHVGRTRENDSLNALKKSVTIDGIGATVYGWKEVVNEKSRGCRTKEKREEDICAS